MGDIKNNNGTGHASCFDDDRYIKDEINPDIKFCEGGIVAMANKGKDTNGSQFFITFDDLPFFDGDYTIIGQVLKGYEIAKNILNICGSADGTPKCVVKITDSGIYKYDDYMRNKFLKF